LVARIERKHAGSRMLALRGKTVGAGIQYMKAGMRLKHKIDLAGNPPSRR